MWYDVKTNERYNDAEMLDSIRDYIDEMDIYEEMDELLDECYPLIKIGNVTLTPSEVLNACAPEDYRFCAEEYREGLYEEVEYYFNHTEKESGETLSHFIEETLSGEFADYYEWREE